MHGAVLALRGSEALIAFPPPQPWALVLTRSLDCDLELPTASALGEHLEVSHFFDTHTLGLQTPPSGAAGMGVTGWEEEER